MGKIDEPAFAGELAEHLEVMRAAAALEGPLERVVEACWNALEAGGKLLWCGNGGSAADAQHLSAEFVVRFRRERRGLPSVALTTDASVMTAAANDYDYSRIFSRQVEALAGADDVLFAISTSGASPNVVRAAEAARDLGVTVVAVTGSREGPLTGLADLVLAVPSDNTARIQECYLFLGHVICERIEQRMEGNA